MIELRLLRFFIAIFEEKNITAAAERCHVSQPSLSAGLKQLEESLDGPLFVRSKKGVEPLESAHYLYPLALRLVEEAKSLPALFKEKASRRKLKIALMPDLGRGPLGQFLGKLHQHIDRLDLELVDYHSSADCRLTLDALRHEDEIFVPLWDEDYVLCAPKDHPLVLAANASGAATPEMLSGYDFIECPPCEAHQQTLGLLACNGMSLNLVARAETKSQVLALVVAGLGVSFLPDGLIADAPSLATVPFKGPRMQRRIGLCYPAHQSISPVLADLLNLFGQD